jgi:hypothetical protein
MDRQRAPRRGVTALMVAAVLLAGGGSAIGWAATHQQHAPQPSPAAAGSLSPAAPGHTSADKSPGAVPETSGMHPVGPLLARSTPTAVGIPAISVRASLQSLGRNPDGTLMVPRPGPQYNEPSWFTGSRTPGELGPAVILGHVDSAADGPSVFFRLGALRPGDRIDITRSDHTVAIFAVNAVREYPKAQFPDAAIFGGTQDAALRLITCGGSFDQAKRSYLSNIVVFAHLVGSQPLPPDPASSVEANKVA